MCIHARAGITIPVPHAANTRRGLDEVNLETEVTELHQQIKTREPGTDDQDFTVPCFMCHLLLLVLARSSRTVAVSCGF